MTDHEKALLLARRFEAALAETNNTEEAAIAAHLSLIEDDERAARAKANRRRMADALEILDAHIGRMQQERYDAAAADVMMALAAIAEEDGAALSPDGQPTEPYTREHAMEAVRILDSINL